jgi:TolB-like protein
MDVLQALAATPGEVVAKERLIDEVWAREFIADSALSRAVFELREALGDDSHHPVYVETIAKRGYRLVAPVTPVEAHSAASRPASRSRRWLRRGLLALPVLAAVAGLGLVTASRDARPSRSTGWMAKIAVLPFENLGHAEDEYLAAGITEEISNRLASAPGLGVVAPPRNDPRVSPTRPPAEIGRELHTDYVLRGAVRWHTLPGEPGKVRISPSLVRCSDDTVVWAAVFDRRTEDVFSLQSEIALTVLQHLQRALGTREFETADPPASTDPEAYQAFLRGLFHTHRQQVARGQEMAITMFRRAVELDPSFARAHAMLARAYSLSYHMNQQTHPEMKRLAHESLQKARALSPDSVETADSELLYLYWCERDFSGAFERLRAARRRFGDRPSMYAFEGYILRRLGRWREALEAQRRALELAPKDIVLHQQTAITAVYLGLYDESFRLQQEVIRLSPDEALGYASASFIQREGLGDLAGARRTLESAPDQSDPDLSRAFFYQELAEGRFEDAISRTERSLPEEPAVDTFDRLIPRSMLLAAGHECAGNLGIARQHHAQALEQIRPRLEAEPNNSRLLQLRGIALAGLGRGAEAIAAMELAVEACPVTRDAIEGVEALESLAEVLTAVGERDRALDVLERLAELPGPLGPKALGLQPRWRTLHGHPRFETLVNREWTHGT